MPAPPTVLIIRDGWGENPHREHDAFNAIRLARTPVADRLARDWPTTLVRTCGEDVGLPETDAGPVMGNSEVGHQNIGAGRIVDQELMRITRAIRDGRFFENRALREACAHALKYGGRLHLIGLLGTGKVHSEQAHLEALIDLAGRAGVPGERILVHCFTDGRDTPPTASIGFMQRLIAALERGPSQPGSGRKASIASIMGRYWAMDRDNRWDRTAKAYRALTQRIDAQASDPIAALEHAHAHPVDPGRAGDEFIEPVQLPAFAPVGRGDAVIFFNFRGDRPRQLTKAFTYEQSELAQEPSGGFDRGAPIANLFFCTLTAYEEGLPVHVAFEKPPKMSNILGEVIAAASLTQFRCAETEKFPHVTFFFNDYRDDPFAGERRELIPSPRDVATYDLKPEMSAAGVRDAVLRRLAADDCESLIVVNFANGDMVGHTGSLPAAIRAVEVVDACVGAIVDATLARNGALIVTADHGNAEQMWDPEHNCPHTAHTIYDVPLHLVAQRHRGAALRGGGRLADLAPTILALMGLPTPAAMTGRDLLVTGR